MRYFLQKRILRAWRRLLRVGGAACPRVVFLHIPKCAGSTVNRHFTINIGSVSSGRTVVLNSMDGTAYDPGAIAKAQSAPYVTGHFGFDTLTAVSGGAITFVFLRDPVRRLLSLYYYCRSIWDAPNPYSLPLEQAHRMDFLDFCLSRDPAIRSFVDNTQARTLAGDYVLHGQDNYDRHAVARQSKTNLDDIDYVGFAKTTDQDIAHLARMTETAVAGKGVVRNKTISPEYTSQDYDIPRLEQALRPVIDLDLALYDYARMNRVGWNEDGMQASGHGP